MDISKLRKGDTVMVKLVFNGNISYGGRVHAHGVEDVYGNSIHPDDIVEIIPAPIEIKVGTKFRFYAGAEHCTVVQVHENEAAFTWIGPGNRLFIQVYSLDIIRKYLQNSSV